MEFTSKKIDSDTRDDEAGIESTITRSTTRPPVTKGERVALVGTEGKAASPTEDGAKEV